MTESTAARIDDADEPQIELAVTRDAMQVLLSCNAAALEAPDFYDRVLTHLRDMYVEVVPERVDFVARVARLKQEGATEITDLPVTWGQEAVPPVDGSAEWSRDYFNSQYVVDPDTGHIDFTRRVGDPSVTEGELLVLVHPPQPGIPGFDVYGNPHPVDPPNRVRLLAGRNVAWDEEASGFRAVRAGRISLEGRRIHVDNVYEIRGALGGRTGCVRHNGTVLVLGDVQDHYELEATEDIEVRGTVYEAEIRCGRNLAAVGGISSNHNGSISVEGTCQTRYAIQTKIEGKGSIVVENELYQTTASTLEDVSCPRGRIVGGSTTARRGIVVGEAGSKVGARTPLVIEADPEIRAGIAAAKKAIESLQPKIAELRERLRMIQRQAASFGEAGVVAIARSEEEIARLEAELAEQSTRMETLVRTQRTDRKARIAVRGRAYPGVVLKVLGHEMRVDREIEGPFVARLDWEKMEIQLTAGLD